MTDTNYSTQSLYNIGREALYPQEQLLELNQSDKSITIGIPKEDFNIERRIPLTPQGVGLLVENGHQVMVEENAGKYARFTDQDYSEAGAIIVKEKKEVFLSDIILKIQPPLKDEIEMMKERSTLISTLNLNNMCKEHVQLMLKKKINAVAFDLLVDENNTYPIMRSISEIEGNVAIMQAARYLSNENEGKGVMLGGVTGISPTEVVILGAGSAGMTAARTALGMGATVKVFDHSLFKLREMENSVGQRIFTSNLHPSALSKALTSADVVIGTIRFLNGAKRFMVSEELIQLMKPNSVIVDLSVDQGGCFETTKATSLDKPCYKCKGVIHICLPNLSTTVAKTASIAYSNILSSLLLQIADSGGIKNLVKEDLGFCKGVYVYHGILVNHIIGGQLDIPSKDIGLLLAAF